MVAFRLCVAFQEVQYGWELEAVVVVTPSCRVVYFQAFVADPE